MRKILSGRAFEPWSPAQFADMVTAALPRQTTKQFYKRTYTISGTFHNDRGSVAHKDQNTLILPKLWFLMLTLNTGKLLMTV